MSKTNMDPRLKRIAIFTTLPLGLILAYVLMRLLLFFVLAPLAETSSPEDLIPFGIQLVCSLLLGVLLTIWGHRFVGSIIDRFGLPGIHEPTPITIKPASIRVGLSLLLKRNKQAVVKEVMGAYADPTSVERFIKNKGLKRLVLSNSNGDYLLIERPALVSFDNEHDRNAMKIKFVRGGKVRFVLEPALDKSALFKRDDQSQKATLTYSLTFLGGSPRKAIGSLTFWGDHKLLGKIFLD
ncbi:MAG: hypothetical protein K8F91_20710 [Candidatus Obscuribacterales bacterium]|nr:hypothetical protein [Candidatus Obscuribacterales bacterium]